MENGECRKLYRPDLEDVMKYQEQIFYCTLCSWAGVLPSDAEKLTKAWGGKTVVYRFNDGSVHAVKKIRKVKVT